MVGIVSSSYYRVPSSGKKGNKPSTETFHKTKGFVLQDDVVLCCKRDSQARVYRLWLSIDDQLFD